MRFVFHYLYPRDLYVGYKNEKKNKIKKKNKKKPKTKKKQQHMHCFMSKMVFKRLLNKSVYFWLHLQLLHIRFYCYFSSFSNKCIVMSEYIWCLKCININLLYYLYTYIVLFIEQLSGQQRLTSFCRRLYFCGKSHFWNKKKIELKMFYWEKRLI